MDVDDNFYDEISSFIPSPDDYTFNDFDEILSSTVSNLDSAFDIDSLVKSEFGLSNLNELQQDQNAFGSLNLSSMQSPSDASTAAISPYSAQRTPSASSADGDLFTSDDLMKFLNDDEMKLEEYTPLNNMDESCLPQRNTPSPTGSCSSSGGSSTSGIQSDASSVIDSKPVFGQDIECGVIMPPTASSIPTNPSVTTHFMHIDDVKIPKTIQTSLAAPVNSTFVPITTSVLPIATNQTTITTTDLSKSTALVRPIQQVTPINIVPGTIIPIQNVPLANVTAVATPATINGSVNIATATTTTHSPLPIKIETKICPTTIKTAAQPVKIVANKVTPATATKPKTIYLSANDFKALMQKVNTDGKTGTKTTTGPFNGQMPKIIMKAPNGKVITSKVATPVSLTNPTATPPSPKIIKTTHGSLQSKQHAQKFVSNSRAAAINILKLNAAGNSPTISPTSSSSGGSSSVTIPDLSIYKGIVDEKMLKKQQRMIKNRESASLSRKKKKEYVISLETRISNLEKENSTLKGENTSLRSQLVAFAQTCQCKNGNAGEFVLNSLNFKVNSEHQHVKIAPKPAPKSMRQKMTAANVRKNVAILFAMAFMVTMNVGNFQNFLNKNSLESAIVESGEELLAANAGNGNPNAISAASAAAGSTRRLLWVPTETEFNKQLNQTKRESEMDAPPPLHFLKPVNRTNGSRKFDEQVNTNAKADEPPLLTTKCGTTTRNNQTEEYLRLATKLHKWIDGNDYLNLSMPYDKYNDDDDYAMDTDMKKGNFKLPQDLFDGKPLIVSGGAKGKRKIYMDPETNYESGKHRKMNLDYVADKLVGDKKSLDLYKPKISEEYLRLFRGIKRQDDTFYVLSFNMDHILLPASAYNKSVRPKMSLMLPAGDPSMNGDIVLMQIDCEVINTTELALKSDMIPEKLRPQKYTGASAGSAAAAPKPNDVANNETGSSSSMNLVEKLHMKAVNNLIPKEKPTVRTYVLVGPKTQEAAAAAKQQPKIVRVSPNDSRFLNVKNSTLISKMRENYTDDIDDVVP